LKTLWSVRHLSKKTQECYSKYVDAYETIPNRWRLRQLLSALLDKAIITEETDFTDKRKKLYLNRIAFVEFESNVVKGGDEKTPLKKWVNRNWLVK